MHPSAGPGGLSYNSSLAGSSTSYASFGNLKPLNAIHQREEDMPSCDNIEALDALYPHVPEVGNGTLYINGEIFYPYLMADNYEEVGDLANNLAIMHKALLDADAAKLASLNSWLDNPDNVVDLKYPTVELGPDILLESWETADIDAGGAGEGNTYNWNTGEITQIIEATTSGLYVVEVTSASGCKAKDSINVFYKSKVFIPSCFTPDGDGKNDFFRPIVEDVISESYSLTIYNKWGQIVFVTSNPKDFWDGGKYKKTDTYVYKMRYKTNERKGWNDRTGHVVLLK